MSRNQDLRRCAVAATILASALSGCGRSGEIITVAAPPPATSSASPTRDAPVSTPRGDRRVARAGALDLADLPVGWETSDEETSGRESPERRSGIRTCRAFRAALDATTATAIAPDFSSESSLVSNVVLVFADDTTAAQRFRVLADEDARQCYGKRLKASSRASAADGAARGQTTITDVTTAALGAAPLGTDTRALRIRIGTSTGGVTRTVPVDLYFTLIGRGVTATYLVMPDGELRHDVPATSARKLQHALAEGP
jgi:hypothetical protein